MRGARRKRQTGQSAVEFLVIAPLLLILFFSTIQLAYMGCVALTVQRAALAMAQEASLTGTWDDRLLRAKLVLTLAPLAKLNKTLLACAAVCRYSPERSKDPTKISVRVSFPMPLWVPVADKILGVPLVKGSKSDDLAGAFRDASQISGISLSDYSLPGTLPYVRWMTFEASAYNEGYPGFMGF